MTFSIDGTRYEFSDSAIPITSAQSAIYAALATLVNDGKTQISSISLVERFKFKSVLPLRSRLDHLVERGRLKLV